MKATIFQKTDKEEKSNSLINLIAEKKITTLTKSELNNIKGGGEEKSIVQW
jgi:bacteriocin-like protein